MSTVGLIGCGNLGTALAEGLAKRPELKLFLFDANQEKAQALARLNDGLFCHSIKELCQASETIIIAVKPKDVLAVLSEIDFDSKISNKLIISVAAGVTSEAIYASVKNKPRLVRTMPNIASTLGKGVTGIWGKQAQDVEFTKSLFSQLGQTVIVNDESMLDTVTGLSGSGPAFIFVVLAGMIEAGVSKGLERKQAETLAVETLKGAAAVFEQAGLSAADLIARVASPGGTTLAGLAVLKAKGVENTFCEAVSKASERATEIGKEVYLQATKR